MFHPAIRRSRTSCLAAFLSISAWAVTVAVSSADTVTLEPVKDNTMFTNAFGDPPDLSNGAGPHIFSGITGFGDPRRGLITFDIAGTIPPGAIIESAEVTLHVSLGVGAVVDHSLHRLVSDWGEGTSNSGTGGQGGAAGGGAGAPATIGDATWVRAFFPDIAWNTPGGDFDPMPSATTSIMGAVVTDYTWSSPQLATDVQGWLDNPGTNFGWLIRDTTETGFGTAKRFDSREHPDPAVRPILTITFSTGGGGCDTCPGDVDDNSVVNGADVQGFLTCLLGGDPMASGCECADADEDGSLTMGDVTTFVGDALATTDCAF